MAVCIFNSLTRKKAPFMPLAPGIVKMYVCGPTVYDEPHLGHARSAVVFDVIRRYFKSRGYRVALVRNVTDIDDKILQKARCLNQDFRILAARYFHCYEQAMIRLNVEAPDAQPKATDFILPIQDYIAQLLQSGHAYVMGGNVYFAVASFENYGKLSRRTFSKNALDARVLIDPDKKHPADFALWKAAVPGEPFWPSPWGPGRPGWHIECSAMSAQLLGEVYDIHGGGQDLIFPHHENGIAQSESLFHKTPATCWMHHGLVYAGGNKISKSQGGFQKLHDLLEIYPANALRLFLLSKRYRHPMAFSHQGMMVARKNMARLERFFSRPDIAVATFSGQREARGALWMKFCSAMDDDFNFPMAMSVLFEGLRYLNRGISVTGGIGNADRQQDLKAAIADLFVICHDILGLTPSRANPLAEVEKRQGRQVDIPVIPTSLPACSLN